MRGYLDIKTTDEAYAGVAEAKPRSEEKPQAASKQCHHSPLGWERTAGFGYDIRLVHTVFRTVEFQFRLDASILID